MKFNIKEYSVKDQDELFTLIKDEGDEWSEYWLNKDKYLKALENSITYLGYEDNLLVGYARAKEDSGYGVYVYDLLVNSNYRGKGYGKLLMEEFYNRYPNQIVYVMSDVDEYYSKLNYQKEGSIFTVTKKHK